jgi:hypothetical protein
MNRLVVYIMILNHLLIGSAWAGAHMDEVNEIGHATVHLHVHANLADTPADSNNTNSDSTDFDENAAAEHDESTHVHLSFQIASSLQPTLAAPTTHLHQRFSAAYFSRSVTPPVPPPNA